MRVQSHISSLLLLSLVILMYICAGSASKNKTINSRESKFISLVGDSLYKWGTSSGTKEIEMGLTSDLLKNKNVVGLYFSASWCGPCRQFTPQLAEFYQRVNKKGKKFEIIFVSQDNSAESFVSYYEKMPWLAVPIDTVAEIADSLSRQYRMKGIPHLVLLDGYDASVITLDGRGKVLSDKYGLEFPYRSRTLINAIPRPIKNLLKSIQSSIAAGISKMGEKAVEKIVRLKNRATATMWSVCRGIVESIVPKRVLQLFRSRSQEL